MHKTGTIYGINGPVIYLKGNTGFQMAEMVYVGKERLVGEVIRLTNDITTIQVFEETTGLRPGEKLYEELLMNEEGLTDTENKLIHIGKPIEFDEVKFYAQLYNLEKAVDMECEDVRPMIQEIVPTYVPKKQQ